MSTLRSAILLALGIAAGVAGGYWLARPAATLSTGAALQPASAAEREILYYRDPSGAPYWSAGPKKDAEGRDYLPVYADEAVSFEPGPKKPPKTAASRRVLYYRNPMGLPDTSPVPKKDSMGMDYIPVFEGDEPDVAGGVKINPAKVQQLGVQIVPAERRRLNRAIRAVGTVQADERRLFVVNTKFEGWIEKLYVNATGQTVRRGEPVMEVYAPELVVAEREYQLAS